MSNSKSKGNYLKLYRSTLNSDIMDCTPVVRELWFWLLMSANWKTDEKKNINRGTWTGTIDDIRNGLSWQVATGQILTARAKLPVPMGN